MTQNLQSRKYQFSEFPVLSNESLLLREITPNDAASIVEISYYDGIPARSATEAREMLQKINHSYKLGDSIHWGICYHGQENILGTCGFYRGYPNNVGEIGYVLKPERRGKGIMTQAARLAVEFGLNKMKLDHVVAYTDKLNIASICVLKRLGFMEVESENEFLKFSV